MISRKYASKYFPSFLLSRNILTLPFYCLCRPDCVTEVRMSNTGLTISGYHRHITITAAFFPLPSIKELQIINLVPIKPAGAFFMESVWRTGADGSRNGGGAQG